MKPDFTNIVALNSCQMAAADRTKNATHTAIVNALSFFTLSGCTNTIGANIAAEPSTISAAITNAGGRNTKKYIATTFQIAGKPRNQ